MYLQRKSSLINLLLATSLSTYNCSTDLPLPNFSKSSTTTIDATTTPSYDTKIDASTTDNTLSQLYEISQDTFRNPSIDSITPADTIELADTKSENTSETQPSSIDSITNDLNTKDTQPPTLLPNPCKTINGNIIIQDQNLENAIKEQLGIPKDKSIPLDIAKNSKNLSLPAKQIKTIEGLECFTAIEELDLKQNEIVNITPLQYLTKLKNIYLQQNKIASLTPLQNLTELVIVSIYMNQITDLNPIGNLNKLEILYASNNPIDTTTFIPKNLPNLYFLTLAGSQISDITFVKYLPALQILQMNNNNITDINILKTLPYLKEIDFSENKIKDINAIRTLSKLEKIDFLQNLITDVTPLKDLSASLKEVDLSGNPIQYTLSSCAAMNELKQKAVTLYGFDFTQCK